MFRKFVERFASLRVTVYLILALSSLFCVGLLVPQKGLLGREGYIAWAAEHPDLVGFLDKYQLTDIYSAYYTLALWGVFFLQLAIVMNKRIPVILRRLKAHSLPASVDDLGLARQAVAGASAEMAMEVLKDMRYRIHSEGASFHAVRNRLSPLATIVFHLSFFLLLLGGVTSFYTKFQGEVNLAEGETFTGQYSRMFGPRIGQMPEAVFVLDYIKPEYYKHDLPTNLDVGITTSEGERVIGINRPYKRGLLSFVIKDLDIAPLFVMTDIKGEPLDSVSVKLKVLNGLPDSFILEDYEFRVIFYTDVLGIRDEGVVDVDSHTPQALKGKPVVRGLQRKEVGDPAVNLAAFRDGKVLRGATIEPGEYIEFEDRRMYFDGYVHWVSMYVSEDFGLPLVYAGMALMCIAPVWRFVLYRRDIRGLQQGNVLYISGRADFFPTLMDEEMDLIKNRVSGYSDVRG